MANNKHLRVSHIGIYGFWVKETAVRSCDDKMVQSQLFSDHGDDRECSVRSVYTGSLRLMLSPNTQMKARKHSLRVSALFIVARISRTITCIAKPIEPKTQKNSCKQADFRLIFAVHLWQIHKQW
mgnify:CR=1 FL=1